MIHNPPKHLRKLFKYGDTNAEKSKQIKKTTYD